MKLYLESNNRTLRKRLGRFNSKGDMEQARQRILSSFDSEEMTCIDFELFNTTIYTKENEKFIEVWEKRTGEKLTYKMVRFAVYKNEIVIQIIN